MFQAIRPLCVGSAIFAATALSSLQASVLVHEGFSYGLADNASIAGTASTGTGVSGNWAVTNTGSASSLYKTAGLTFGSNFQTGSSGSLQLTGTYSGSDGISSATVKLGNTGSGTVWGSYLVRFSTIGAANSGSFTAGVSPLADGTSSSLKSGLASNTAATDRKLLNGYDTVSTSSGNFAFATNTTYLFISRFTNVGTELGGGTNGVGTTWALTLAQYESWLSSGATEAGLDSNYSVRVSDTVTTGTYSYGTNGYLSLRADSPDNNGSSISANIDELRFATSLSEVYVVPEPSVAAMAFGAGLILLERRRRNP